MKITFAPIDEAAARAIVRWRYQPPYDVYNIDDCDDSIQYVLDPQNNFFMMHAEDQLVGFCSFGRDGQVPGGDYSQSALDIGMGIRPELTGQGRGSSFVTAVLAFACQEFAPEHLRVTIAAFNQPARRVWQKNGFEPVQTFEFKKTGREFIIMTRKAQPNP